MEIAYSLAGDTAIELASSDNTDDEEDTDDPCDKTEEKSNKDNNLFIDCSSISTPVFMELSMRAAFAEMSYPIAFHLIEPPYSPPEMI